MKKLLGVLLAMTLSWPVSASVLSNVEVKGEIQTIASDVRTNNATLTYNTGASARVLAGLSADLVEDVTANLLFQYANLWGGDVAAGNSMQDYWNAVRLVEANVAIHNLFCAFDVTVGRQFYGDEDSAVMYVGPNHYNAEFNGYASSLDAVKLVYADDVKALTLMAGRTNETLNRMSFSEDISDAHDPYLRSGRFINRNYNMYGGDFKLHLGDNLTAQVYGYDFRNDDLSAVDEEFGFYGAKLAANVEAFRASAEYARNFGGHRLVKEHHDTGHMVKADIAADIKAVTARGTFLYANENFVAFGNYTPGLLIGHDLGGRIWDYSSDGVAMFNVGFDVRPFDKWVFSLDGYSFQDHRMDHSATLEADLTAKYNHNEYVQLFAGVGYAKYTRTDGYPTIYQRDILGSDNVKGQIGMLIKF